MHPAFGLLLGYLLGSIPFAYIAGKVSRGIDLRQHGSGNLGATNVYRTLGAKVASVVFVLDTLKGALPVLAVQRYAIGTHLDLWAIAAGVAAIVGHAKPIFLLWKGGGKGVATGLGAFVMLAPKIVLIALGIFVAMVFAFRYISLASIVTVAVFPLFAWLLKAYGNTPPVLAVMAAASAFIIAKHRGNIRRLAAGTEPRFQWRRG